MKYVELSATAIILGVIILISFGCIADKGSKEWSVGICQCYWEAPDGPIYARQYSYDEDDPTTCTVSHRGNRTMIWDHLLGEQVYYCQGDCHLRLNTVKSSCSGYGRKTDEIKPKTLQELKRQQTNLK